MECLFKRAISPEQKAIRQEQILLAAAKHFENERFEKINLNTIAADVGITKAALYRYFRSKEALFLALYDRSFGDLVDGMEARKTGSLVDDVTDTLLDHPLYCRLSAILHTVLENNVTAEEARNLKFRLLEHFNRLAGRLVADYGFPPREAAERLMQVHQAVIGCWHMCNPTEPMASVVKEEESLKVFDLDFGETLKAHLSRIFAKG